MDGMAVESPGIGQPLTYVNDHVGKMLGFTRTEWLDPAWWESRLHPDDHARALEAYRSAFAAREPFTVECRLRRADETIVGLALQDVDLPAPEAQGHDLLVEVKGRRVTRAPRNTLAERETVKFPTP